MELLLPKQFLDTEEKKNFYNNFEVKQGKIRKTKETSTAGTEAGKLEMDRHRATANGFKTIIITNERVFNMGLGGAPYKFLMDNNESALFQSMGYDLATGIGVDAVLAVCMVTQKVKKEKEDYGLSSVSLYMWGPNPIQIPEEEDKGLKGLFYIRGQFYSGSRVYYDKPLFFQKSGKKGTEKGRPVYKGMDNIMISLTDNIGKYFQRRLDK